MAPHSGHRSRSGRKQFPTSWTTWEWNNKWKCEYRWRRVADNGRSDDIEYDYRYVDEQTPRDQTAGDPAPALETIREAVQQDRYNDANSSESNYTYQYNLENTTTAFAQQNLSSSGYVAPPVAFSYPHTLMTDSPYTPATIPQPQWATFGSSSRNDIGQGSTSTIYQSKERRISTQNPNTKEDLDPNFKVHSSKDFKFGRVFKVLWSEPHGIGGTEISLEVDQARRYSGNQKSKYNEAAYHSVRRFVIVRENNGHCLCLPILTYGGQATLKRGVHSGDHAVIYTTETKGAPSIMPGELLAKKALRMVPKTPRDKLDLASRVNYAKVYTVEHNVKVFFVGRIEKSHEQRLVTDYNLTQSPLPDRQQSHIASEPADYGHTQGADPYYYQLQQDTNLDNSQRQDHTSTVENQRQDGGYIGQEYENQTHQNDNYEPQDDLYDA
ncbi:hypothetical protein B0O99DRAFT_631715 [Bisporella sp. PMI_857]|nr:hypothetical protein B0O99DRAFT_631715 [Bisporella sp. PMI_857]